MSIYNPYDPWNPYAGSPVESINSLTSQIQRINAINVQTALNTGIVINNNPDYNLINKNNLLTLI